MNGSHGAESDASLVARVVANDDRGAFELLVRRHQSSLRNFLRRLTRGDSARADDIAQEAFLKAYRSLHGFKGEAVFDLCYRRGMAQTEIAEALEMPLGTVKSDMTRGLERLRTLLGLKEDD